MSTLNEMQSGYLVNAITKGEGLIELGELAAGLGKQKGNVTRKLETNFDADALLKMKSGYIQRGGKGASREVSTYMLDYKTAAALAMSYDLQLGIEVLTLLEEAVQTIGDMTKAVQAGDTQEALRVSLSFAEKQRSRLTYSPDDSENETQSKALKRLSRRGGFTCDF